MQKKLPKLSDFRDHEKRDMIRTVLETSRVVDEIIEKHRRQGIEYKLINGKYQAVRRSK